MVRENVDTLAASVSQLLDHTSGLDADHVLSNTSLGYTYYTVLVVFAISTASLSRSIDSVISHNAEETFLGALDTGNSLTPLWAFNQSGLKFSIPL
jgi:hypothetical protein